VDGSQLFLSNRFLRNFISDVSAGLASLLVDDFRERVDVTIVREGKRLPPNTLPAKGKVN
jgi:hypothetical protein